MRVIQLKLSPARKASTGAVASRPRLKSRTAGFHA